MYTRCGWLGDIAENILHENVPRDASAKGCDMNRITINPAQCGGRPCIRGMRIRVKDVLDMLAEGATEQEILQDYPDLQLDDIRACLSFASAYFDHPVLVHV